MSRTDFATKVDEARTAGDMRGQWWQLVYNEQCAPAAQWFTQRGWTAEETALTDYLCSVGPVSTTMGAEVTNMMHSITFVSAVKN